MNNKYLKSDNFTDKSKFYYNVKHWIDSKRVIKKHTYIFPDEDITIPQTMKTIAQNLTSPNKSQENKT